MSIWDLATPVIAQVHGYCLAGGSELATGCDLVYVAEDAKIGYPAVRFGVPDMQFHAWFMGMRTAMEMMLTGDSISGVEAARLGWANRAFPAEALDDEVLAVASRIAKVPPDIAQLNKRTVHRAMDVMGLRAAIRAGTELCALAIHQQGFQAFIDAAQAKGLVAALTERDGPFGDYRTTEPHEPSSRLISSPDGGCGNARGRPRTTGSVRAVARLLIVHHTPSPACTACSRPCGRAPPTPQIEGVEVVARPALAATAVDVLEADGYLLGDARQPRVHGRRAQALLRHRVLPVPRRHRGPALRRVGPRQRRHHRRAGRDREDRHRAAVEGRPGAAVDRGGTVAGGPDACWELGAAVSAGLAPG